MWNLTSSNALCSCANYVLCALQRIHLHLQHTVPHRRLIVRHLLRIAPPHQHIVPHPLLTALRHQRIAPLLLRTVLPLQRMIRLLVTVLPHQRTVQHRQRIVPHLLRIALHRQLTVQHRQCIVPRPLRIVQHHLRSVPILQRIVLLRQHTLLLLLHTALPLHCGMMQMATRPCTHPPCVDMLSFVFVVGTGRAAPDVFSEVCHHLTMPSQLGLGSSFLLQQFDLCATDKAIFTI